MSRGDPNELSLPDPQRITQRLLNRANITDAPVELSKIVSIWKNLCVVQEELDGAGYLLPIGELGAEILVNRNDPDVRRTFTVAHELGHWVLGLINKRKLGRFSQPANVPRAVLEKWCDSFATHLLMPASIVRDWLPPLNKPLLIDAILRASEQFRVSEDAFFIRAWEVSRIQIAKIRIGPPASVERDYSTVEFEKVLSQLLRDPRVSGEFQMKGSMIYFTFRDKDRRVSVSGKKIGKNRAVVALAWL